jgi:hypothetical protein
MAYYFQDACYDQNISHKTQVNEMTLLLGIGCYFYSHKFIGLDDRSEKLPQEWLYRHSLDDACKHLMDPLIRSITGTIFFNLQTVII